MFSAFYKIKNTIDNGEWMRRTSWKVKVHRMIFQEIPLQRKAVLKNASTDGTGAGKNKYFRLWNCIEGRFYGKIAVLNYWASDYQTVGMTG
jgi:hypothetical protein